MLAADDTSHDWGQPLSEFDFREMGPSLEERSPVADSRAIEDELLGAVMSLIPDAAVVADAEGRIVAVNSHAEEMFGYSQGSLPGLPLETLIPERVRRRHYEHRARYVADPRSRPMGAGLELTGRRRDGTEFAIDISLAPLTNEGQRLVVAAVRDISEQRRAAAAQAELAAIVGSSSDAIISMTLEGQVTNWNKAAHDMFGYSPTEIVGKHVATLVPAPSSPILEDLLAAATEGRFQEALDTRWRHRDGHELDVSVSISPMRDRDGRLRGFSSIVRDNTEHKRDEAELRRLLAEEERLQRQHAVASEIRLALLSGTSLDATLVLICRRASELLEAPVAVVAESDPPRVRVGVGAAHLVGSTSPDTRSLLEALTERAASLGPPDCPALGVPVVVAGVAAAELIVVRAAGGAAFDRGARAIAEALGEQISLAFEFEKVRRLSEQNVLAGDRERIARDLHDHVIQRLFAAGLSLQASQSMVEDPATLGRLSEVVDVLDETIREIRNTIFSLSLSQERARSVRWQIAEVVREVSVALEFEPRVEFVGRDEASIPIRLVPHVVACAREALTNVARHAHASEALVELVVSDDSLTVVVTDNGVGIGTPTRSSGLGNLENRTRLLGGRFEIADGPRGGTRASWTVPLAD